MRIAAYGIWLALVVLGGAFLLIYSLLEKVVLVDSRAFCCKQCGYDLQGQVEPRCPECGLEFDPTEKARILERIGKPAPRPRYGWVAIVLIVLVTLMLLGNILAFRRMRPAAPGPGTSTTAPAATPSSTPNPG
jgi:hypothetical protein